MKILDFNYDLEINKGEVVLDFYSDTCGPCKMLFMQIDSIEHDKVSDDYTLVKVNVEEYPDIAGEYEVISVPTLVKLKDGGVVTKHNGFMLKPSLIELIKK